MKTPEKRGMRIVVRIALTLLGSVIALELLLRLAGYYYRASFLDAAATRQPVCTVTILALGESTTAGLWVPREDSYPDQLERLLRAHYRTHRIRVLIPPHIGQNTSQMVRRFQHYLSAFRPALVIIMAGVNNTWSLAGSNLGDFMPSGDWRTNLFRFRRWSDDVKIVRLVRLLATGSAEAWHRLRSDLEGRPLYTRWPPKRDPLVAGIGPEPFRRLWRSDVGRMVEEAKAARVGVILMTYPNYDTPPVSEFEAMARKWSVPLVENHRSFDILIAQGRAKEFFFEDLRHPRAQGYAIVAENAARAIMATGLLEDRLSAKESLTEASSRCH